MPSPSQDKAAAAAYPHFRDGTEACAGVNPEVFFPASGQKNNILHRNLARQICRRCPLAEECLEWAISTRQEFGILGGATPGERRKIRATRGEAR